MSFVEFAGEGHNDAPMIPFALLALLLAVHVRPARAVLMLALGVALPLVVFLLLSIVRMRAAHHPNRQSA